MLIFAIVKAACFFFFVSFRMTCSFAFLGSSTVHFLPPSLFFMEDNLQLHCFAVKISPLCKNRMAFFTLKRVFHRIHARSSVPFFCSMEGSSIVIVLAVVLDMLPTYSTESEISSSYTRLFVQTNRFVPYLLQ